MIYIETGSTDVYYIFGLEYYFAAEKKLPEPVLLFWRTTPTLMVGKYQNILEEINKPYGRRPRDPSGPPHVRRRDDLYGSGRLAFTFIEHSDQTQIDFSQYIGPVVDAVRELGADAGFNGRNDLLIGGRKFSGNAQYRLPGCIVHHGSLLYDTDLAQMAAATTVDPYKIQSKSIKSVRDRVTNISEHLPRKLPAEQFKACMLRHLMRGARDLLPDARRRRAHPSAGRGKICGLGRGLRPQSPLQYRADRALRRRQVHLPPGRAARRDLSGVCLGRFLLDAVRRDHCRRRDRLPV